MTKTLSRIVPFQDQAYPFIKIILLTFLLLSSWSPPNCLAKQDTLSVDQVGIDQEYEPYGNLDWIERHKIMAAVSCGTIFASLLLLIFWNGALKRQLRAKTADLQTSEEKFRQLTENSRDVFWMTDPEKNTVLYVSPAYAEVWGRRVESVYASSQSWLEAIHPEDRFRVQQRATHEQGAGTYSEEFRLLRPDGTVRWIFNQAFPIRDNSGTVYRIAGVAQDITERKQAEEALLLSRQQLETIIETIPDVVYLKDGQGHWQIVNQAGLRLFQVEDLAWQNKNELELIALRPEMEPALRGCMESDEQAWLGGELSRAEECIPDQDGVCLEVIKVPLFAEKGGERKGLVVVGRDITERRRLEKALVEQEKEITTIFEHVPLVMLLVDKDHKIRRVNRTATKFTGLTETDMLGQLPGIALSCAHAHDIPDGCGVGPFCQHCQIRRMLLESLTQHDDHLQQEVKHQFVIAGKVKHLTLFVSTVSLTVRQEPMVLVAIQDVSEYKDLEDQLQQTQKMDSLGTLAGGIAHDFNNILAAVIGFTDLALMECMENTTLEADLRQVRQAADRATALVRQILTFSRREPHEKIPLQICLVVKEALKLLRASIPTTIAFKSDITSKGTVFADPTQIHQLVMNLCTNAYHAMQETGGELRVSVKEMTCAKPSNDSGIVIPPGHYTVLTVSDTGCGMDTQTISRIFEPYFSTKAQGKGTGLGLAVVHGIVKGHQGQIAVSSEQGRGSTFTVYLPASKQDATVTDIDQLMPLASAHQRIMVVDDEESIRDLSSQFLMQAGYEVDQFANGAEAWQALQKTPDAWDLLLTDQTMPEMTGAQLSAKIRGLRPNLPIILNSGYLEGLKDQQFQETESFVILIKPVERHRLLVSVSEILGKRT